MSENSFQDTAEYLLSLTKSDLGSKDHEFLHSIVKNKQQLAQLIEEYLKAEKLKSLIKRLIRRSKLDNKL